jgi:hypothetical protein
VRNTDLGDKMEKDENSMTRVTYGEEEKNLQGLGGEN